MTATQTTKICQRCKDNGYNVEFFWNPNDLSPNGKPLPYESATNQKHNCPFSTFAVDRGYKDKWLKEMEERFSKMAQSSQLQKPAANETKPSKGEALLREAIHEKNEVIEEQRTKIAELSEALTKVSFVPASQKERELTAIEAHTSAVKAQTDAITTLVTELTATRHNVMPILAGLAKTDLTLTQTIEQMRKDKSDDISDYGQSRAQEDSEYSSEVAKRVLNEEEVIEADIPIDDQEAVV